MPKIESLTITSADKNGEQLKLSYILCWQNVKWCYPFPLSYDPPILLLDIYPKEIKSYIHTGTYTWMFIAAFFIIAPKCTQPKCYVAGDGINKLCYIHRMK